MKYSAIILLLFLSLTTWSQEIKKTAQAAKSISVSKENNTSKELHVENKGAYVYGGTKQVEEVRSVEYYDFLITAIKVKMEYVKSDEVENKKAIENGWFHKMDEIIRIAEEEKAKLQSIKK